MACMERRNNYSHQLQFSFNIDRGKQLLFYDSPEKIWANPLMPTVNIIQLMYSYIGFISTSMYLSFAFTV